MHIRQAITEDVRAIRDVMARAYDVYQVLLGYTPPVARDDPAPRIAHREVWVGERDSTVMAALVAETHRDHLLVVSAVVDPDWQGEGHGHALFQHAEWLAQEAGVPEVRMFANAAMTRNIALYRHCGFRVVAQAPHPSHAAHEMVELAKRLD